MCGRPRTPRMAPPPAAPPTLDQLAPKSAKADDASIKRKGLSRYAIDSAPAASNSTQLGGIPKKTGV